MNISWNSLSNFNYWFEGILGSKADVPTIETSSPFFSFYVYAALIITGIGILMLISNNLIAQTHPLKQKLSLWGSQFSWIGVLGMCWFSFRQLKVSLLGGRFWVLFGIVWLGILFAIMVRYFITNFQLEYKYYLSKKTK
jgi:hypothetical protein